MNSNVVFTPYIEFLQCYLCRKEINNSALIRPLRNLDTFAALDALLDAQNELLTPLPAWHADSRVYVKVGCRRCSSDLGSRNWDWVGTRWTNYSVGTSLVGLYRCHPMVSSTRGPLAGKPRWPACQPACLPLSRTATQPQPVVPSLSASMLCFAFVTLVARGSFVVG